MTNPHAHRLPELVAEARAAAANPEHIWDRRAIDWPLTSESTVVEVGGYKGRWALQIAERYHPRLFVFEPQPWAFEVCRAALGDAAVALPYGLGAKSGVFAMGAWETDGCSFVKDASTNVGRLEEIEVVFILLGITTIDLMLMNIEGYEYTLLPHMLDCGILPKRLMVQFHPFDDPYGMHLAKIHERMEQLGYRIPWTYGLLLTVWERE